MAFTQAQIDALKEAISLGATKVQYEDKTVEYRSLKDMKETLAMMEAEVNGTQRSTIAYPSYSKGL